MNKVYVDKKLAEQAMLDLHVKVDGDGYVWALQRDAFHAVNELPAADVRENVYGKWNGVVVTQPYIRCSVCGHSCHMKTTIDSWGVKGVDVWNYCPNCGASMESCY